MTKCPYHLNTPELLKKKYKDYKTFLKEKGRRNSSTFFLYKEKGPDGPYETCLIVIILL